VNFNVGFMVVVRRRCRKITAAYPRDLFVNDCCFCMEQFAWVYVMDFDSVLRASLTGAKIRAGCRVRMARRWKP